MFSFKSDKYTNNLRLLEDQGDALSRKYTVKVPVKAHLINHTT